jgi:hypothetical protein
MHSATKNKTIASIIIDSASDIQLEQKQVINILIKNKVVINTPVIFMMNLITSFIFIGFIL